MLSRKWPRAALFWLDCSDRRRLANSPRQHAAPTQLAPPATLGTSIAQDSYWEAAIDNMKDAVKPTLADPALQMRLAKYIVQRCVRNSVLEDLHAGIAPSSRTGDYSDVVVCTPFGEIPWRRLSRFDDAEMKMLMIDVVNRTYQLIHQLFDQDVGRELLCQLAERDLLPGWEDPKLNGGSTV